MRQRENLNTFSVSMTCGQQIRSQAELRPSHVSFEESHFDERPERGDLFLFNEDAEGIATNGAIGRY